jgi:hypothetical protein
MSSSVNTTRFSSLETTKKNNCRFLRLSTTLFVFSAVLHQTADAFVSTTTASCRPHRTTASAAGSSSTTLYYAMPDVATMKANQMREELESYGINTKTMFDKRDFEQALLDARRDYEQTIKDCMGSAQAYTDKEKQRTSSQKKTVNYDRTNPDHFHEREQMWNMDSDYVHAKPGPNAYYNDPYAYGAPPGGRRGHMGVEEDPLFAHEAQYAYGGARPGPGPRPGPRPGPGGPRRRYYHPEDRPPHANPEGPAGPTGPTGGARREPHPQYSDPAVQMKYHQALDKSYTMRVDELQKELNERGISTKYCFVFADFCVAYAKAVAEDKPKTKKADDVFDGDEDYDPSYRDVVMERYDPTKIL